MASLKSLLKEIRKENSDLRWFVPHAALRDLMTRDNIRAFLDHQIKPYHLEETTDSVFRDGVRIFAILIMIDQVPSLPRFMETQQLHDSLIPFSEVKGGILPESKVDDFLDIQWELSAPEFSRGTLTHRFHKRTRLPFVMDDKIDEGGFGTVYEFKIDPSHQQLDECFRQRLVRKELGDSGTHSVELENLSLLSLVKHRNILELLVSYSHKGKNNLVFPYATGRTLSDFLNENLPYPELQSQESILIALAGLASGIECFHDFVNNKLSLRLTGFHHDLRPKNILVSGREFILADFGLSKFKTMSENTITNFKFGGGDYVAPECEDIRNGFKKLQIHRSSDIWSFGCILAEVATYMVLGAAGVQEFRKKRKFPVERPTGGENTFSLFHCGPQKENDSVHRWLSGLEELGSKPLRLILLLVRGMLSLQENLRPKAKEVTSRLERIAICALTEEIIVLFPRLQTSSNSTDAIFEQERFRAWKLVMEIAQTHIVKPNIEPIQHFHRVVDLLGQLRNVLKDQSSGSLGNFDCTVRTIGHLNEQLHNLLSPDERGVARLHFQLSVIQNDDGRLSGKNIGLSGNSNAMYRDCKLGMAIAQMLKLADDHKNRNEFNQQLDIHAIDVGVKFGNHNLGTLCQNDSQSKILIEWRPYNPAYIDESINSEMFTRLEAVSELLSMEKPTAFRGLNCRGFFHDPIRREFGTVFDVPSRMNTVINLKKLIINKHNIASQPILEDKFELALTVAQSVLEFHIVGWVHKQINSSNIAFFPHEGEFIGEYVKEPYIIGFNHSRPNEPSAFTDGYRGIDNDLYQHPRYLSRRERYQVGYDYYSLGLVLLEIGLWMPLKELGKKYVDGKAEEMRQALLSSKVPLLGQTMGLAYRDLVRACLDDRFVTAGEPGGNKCILGLT